jgi:phosphoglycolate phosphatase
MNALSLPALIFDLDGTLVDTAPDLLAAMNAVLIQQGRRRLDPETLRHMVGFGAASLIRQAMAETGDPVPDDDLPGLVNDFVAYYGEHIADASVPFAGVIETLRELQAHRVPMGVLTNKPQELALPLLDALNMSRFFGAIHGAGRFSYVKPDPRAAKAPVILLSYGYTPDPVETLGADAVTADFRDIPGLVRQLRQG